MRIVSNRSHFQRFRPIAALCDCLTMRAPQFAAVTIALDTAKYRARRPDERSEKIGYLLDRLLSGEEVAKSALEHHGLKVTIREALSPEILD